MWGLFDRKKRQPIAVKACRITWHYEHTAELLVYPREANTRDFAAWVLTVVEAETITRRQLISLYAEFCEVHQVRPMAWGRFDRSLRPSGFQRHRLSSAGRPWVYRIARPGSAIIYKMSPPIAVLAPQQRRAAV